MRFLVGVLVGLVFGALLTIAAGCYFGILTVEIGGKGDAVIVDKNAVSIRK